MIYCSFEPGLFILRGLPPHEINKAFAVVKSLILHKKMMDQINAQIPMTREFLDIIYSALNDMPVRNPPLESELRSYIIATLTKMSNPPLPPADLAGTKVTPDFVSDWIDDTTKEVWLDSLASAMFEEFTNDEIKLLSATWSRENLPSLTYASNPNLCLHLEIENHEWRIPVISSELDWHEEMCLIVGWPEGVESVLIDSYAKRNLQVSFNQIERRRKIRFDPSCHREIQKEVDENVRMLILDVIARRAYNCLMPEHHDETISGQPGVRRVYVKKMSPAIRLHYVMDDEVINFIMYSNGDHDRGL